MYLKINTSSYLFEVNLNDLSHLNKLKGKNYRILRTCNKNLKLDEAKLKKFLTEFLKSNFGFILSVRNLNLNKNSNEIIKNDKNLAKKKKNLKNEEFKENNNNNNNNEEELIAFKEKILEILKNSNSKRPLIVNFENSNEIFYKYHNLDFQKYEKVTATQKLDPKNIFNFEILLNLLKNLKGGKFFEKLLEIELFDIEVDQNGRKLLEFAARHNDILCMRFLMLFDFHLCLQDQFYEKIVVKCFEKCNFDGILSILNLRFNFSYSFNDKKVFDNENIRKIAKDLVNALESAIKNGSKEVVRFLINFDDLKDIDDGSLTGIAFENDLIEIFLMLIRADFKFPQDFQLNPLNINSEELKAHLEVIDKLHEAVKFKSREEFVENFTKFKKSSKFINSKHFYNRQNVSLPITAIKCRKLEIFDFLARNGIFTAAHEDIRGTNEPYDKLPIDQKQKLSKLETKIQNNSIPAFDGFKLDLMKFFKLKDDTPINKREAYQACLENSLKLICENPTFTKVLQFIAEFDKIKIIFDFSCKFDHRMYPSDHEKTSHGRTEEDVDGNITVCIGAKELLENSRESLATIAHEVFHVALFLRYRNDANPCVAGAEKDKKFTDLVDECRKNQELDILIKKVFNKYEEEEYLSELLAAAAEIEFLSHDHDVVGENRFLDQDNPTSSEFESNFPKLHNEFHRIIKEEFNIEELKAINKVNNEFHKKYLKNLEISINSAKIDVNHEFMVINSNCRTLTLKKLFNLRFIEKMMFIGDEFTEVVEETLELDENVIRILNSNNKITLVLGLKKFPNKINNLSGPLSNRIIVVTNKAINLDKFTKSTKTIQINHKWTDVEKKCREKFLNQPIKFQNREFNISNLPVDVLYSSLLLDDMINDREISVGNELKKLDFYVSREFQLFDNNFIKEGIAVLNSLLISFDKTFMHVLIDIPGMGKTTTLKFISQEIKKIKPKSWIEYLEATNCISIFENHENDQINDDEILDMVCNILKIQHKNLLEKFVENQKFILFFDALDEIFPICKKKCISFIHACNRLKIKMWITTRPQYKYELQANFNKFVGNEKSVHFNCKFMMLIPLSIPKQKEFLTLYHEKNLKKFQNIDINDRVTEILELISKKLKGREFNTPLLLKILADTFEELKDKLLQCKTPASRPMSPHLKYPNELPEVIGSNLIKHLDEIDKIAAGTFSSEGTFLQTQEEPNVNPLMYTIYEVFIKKVIDEFLRDRGQIVAFDTEKFKYHNFMRIIEVLGVNYITHQPTLFDTVDEKLREDLTLDELDRIGIIYVDCNEILFTHLSFAEFSTAKFICENLFNEYNERAFLNVDIKVRIIDILFEITRDNVKLTNVNFFIKSYCEDHKINYSNEIIYNRLKKFDRNILLDRTLSKIQTISTIESEETENYNKFMEKCEKILDKNFLHENKFKNEHFFEYVGSLLAHHINIQNARHTNKPNRFFRANKVTLEIKNVVKKIRIKSVEHLKELGKKTQKKLADSGFQHNTNVTIQDQVILHPDDPVGFNRIRRSINVNVDGNSILNAINRHINLS